MAFNSKHLSPSSLEFFTGKLYDDNYGKVNYNIDIFLDLDPKSENIPCNTWDNPTNFGEDIDNLSEKRPSNNNPGYDNNSNPDYDNNIRSRFP